jgi:hypothetical protein
MIHLWFGALLRLVFLLLVGLEVLQWFTSDIGADLCEIWCQLTDE